MYITHTTCFIHKFTVGYPCSNNQAFIKFHVLVIFEVVLNILHCH